MNMEKEKEPLRERLITKEDMWECLNMLEGITFIYILIAIPMDWPRNLMLWLVHIGYSIYFFYKIFLA